MQADGIRNTAGEESLQLDDSEPGKLAGFETGITDSLDWLTLVGGSQEHSSMMHSVVLVMFSDL